MLAIPKLSGWFPFSATTYLEVELVEAVQNDLLVLQPPLELRDARVKQLQPLRGWQVEHITRHLWEGQRWPRW